MAPDPHRPTPHRIRAVVGWAVAVLVSALLTVQMAQGPTPSPVGPPPAPIDRPPTPEERAEVEQMGADLAHALRDAHVRNGAPLPVEAYERADPTGKPWLASGLPDNPLAPNVAWAWAGCPDQPVPTPSPDWLVCSRDGTLRAGGLTNSPAWPIVPQGSGKP